MDDSKWGTWLRAVTGEQSIRGIARAAGVTHPTVRRWLVKGVPPQTVWEITLRFKADPVETLIMLGRVTPERVHELNFSAVVKYADADVLTAELHNRAMRARAKPVRSDEFKGCPFDLRRQSFRLTAKES